MWALGTWRSWRSAAITSHPNDSICDFQAALLFALLARRRKAQQAKRGGLGAQLSDTLRYTTFLGTFAGVYVAVDEGLAALFGNKRCVTAAFLSCMKL